MVSSWMAEAARRFGDRPAVMGPEGAIGYRELARRVDETAAKLMARGVKPGASVALWGANSLDWVVTAHAVWRAGATLIPVSTRWTDVEVAAALNRLPGAPCLVLGNSELVVRACGLGLDGVSFADLAAGPDHGPLPEAAEPDAIAAILFTSGTSGVPKAAMLSHRALAAGAEGVGRAIALGPDDRWWLAMPFFHVGGLSALWRCTRYGAAAVIASRFEPDGAIADWHQHGVTIVSLVPTMLQALLDRAWPSSVRFAMLGGAATPAALLAACPVARPSYGLTEACSTVTMVRPDDPPEAHATSGAPIPGVEVAILDADGNLLPPGHEGEIAVAGPTLMTGYAADPAPWAGRWLRTGDFGSLDGAGRLTVLGRRTDLIVSGGENIYPAEVEAALTAHPDVSAAAVVGVPHPRWGATPFAFVVGAPALTEAELGAWLGDRLARFKHPKGYAFVSALPLLANGKVDRVALRAEIGKQGYEEEVTSGGMNR